MTSEITPQEKELAKLIAKHFIARPELRAVQHADGSYRPLHQPFTMTDIVAHLRGTSTYGHYTTDSTDHTKLFCFDLDLNKAGDLPLRASSDGQFMMFMNKPLREHWGSRKPGAGRDFLKLQMKKLANQLASAINSELEIPTAVTYSGSKGLHVYGFTGKTTANLAREGAKVVLESLAASQQGFWELKRGNNFYGYRPADEASARNPAENFSQFELEVYPKQDSLDGKEKGLGNLLRLPLGVNLKSPKRDKGFFLDLRTALTEFTPRDSVDAITTMNQWQ